LGFAVFEALSKELADDLQCGAGAAGWIEDGDNRFLVPPGEVAAPAKAAPQ
jgi:hypothetical protein